MHSFYQKVQIDPVIGHIFKQVDWDEHTPIICNFWENILFQTSNYAGNPMAAHLDLNEIFPLTPHHFDRWKQLFFETVDHYFSGEKAALAKQRALSIAAIIQNKIIQNGHNQNSLIK
jgi:hemoglobin